MVTIDLRSYDPTTTDDAPLPLRGSRQPRCQMRSARPHDDSAQVRKACRAHRKAMSRWFLHTWPGLDVDVEDSDEMAAYLAELRDERNMGGGLIDDYRGWGGPQDAA